MNIFNKSKQRKKNPPPVDKNHYNKFETKFDWLQNNTEILFKEKNDEKNFQNLNTISVTLSSNILEDEEKKIHSNHKENITKQALIQLPHANKSQIQKRIEFSSTLHSDDYYNKTIDFDNLHPITEKYELKSSRSNSIEVDIKEIEQAFAKNGVHLYGIKENSNKINGKIKSLFVNIRESKKR